MATVVLFHHVLGLTDGVREFAAVLEREGHQVACPDLFDGRVFASIEEGSAHADSIGMMELLSTAEDMARTERRPVVYAGFSLGALMAHKLAQTMPNAVGALLYHYGDVPMHMFGNRWPGNVPIELHISQHDPWREDGVVEAFVSAVEPTASASMFLYDGAAHLFTDSSSVEYDAAATRLLLRRTREFLAGIMPESSSQA